MIKICQKLLISALIFLQVISPLVHAHSHVHIDDSHFGLHLPGLEFANQQQQQFAFSSPSTCFDDGVIISVSSGIKQNPLSLIGQQHDQDSGYLSVFTQPGIYRNYLNNFLDLSSRAQSPFHFCTARAPPAQ